MSDQDKRAIEHPGVHRFPGAAYSRALRVGRMILISGTVAVDEDGNLVGEGDLEAQTRQVFVNIGRLLAAAGAGFEHVVRLNYFLTDMSRWPEASAVRREFIAEPYPTSTAIEVSRLVDPGWLIEIEGLAVLPVADG